jgi:hypothetical protein
MPGLLLRRYADKSNPDAQFQDLPNAPFGFWPVDLTKGVAGVEHIGEPTPYAEVATSVVARGIAEGWITGTGEVVVHRPGGPPDDPWRVTHTFRHFDTLTIAGVEYTVTHQPDKYADYDHATYPDDVEPFMGTDDTPVGEPTDDIYSAGATRVDWFYGITLSEELPHG